MITLTPVISTTPGNPLTYNPSIADTFSWIPIENNANRPLYARAGYITNLSDITVSLSAGSLSIGAVEIKDGNSNRTADVEAIGNGFNALRVLTQALNSTADSVTIGDIYGNLVGVNQPLSALRIIDVAPVTAVNISNTVEISGSVTVTNPTTAVSIVNQISAFTVLNPISSFSIVNQLTSFNISNTVEISGSVTLANPVTAVNILNSVALRDLNNNNVSVTSATSSLNVNVTNPIVATVDPLVGFPISFAHTPSVDAFGRLRVSTPLTLFDSSHRYRDNNLWSSLIDVGGSVSFNQNQGLVELTVNGLSGSSVIRETTKVFAYQPGKALRNGEPVLTPSGWVNIENLKIGDKVFDGLGNITEVLGVYPQGKRKIFRFTFDDETAVDADEDHLWVTIIRNNGKKGKKGTKRILTTKQMIEEQGNVPSIQARWRIPGPPTLKTEETPVDIDPYTLGAILGDGHIAKTGFVTFTTADTEILEYIICKEITKKTEKYNYSLLGLSESMRNYDLQGKLFNTKTIPDAYKFNSERVRLEVLRGLMDTDGWIESDKCTYYATGSKQLAEDVCFLVRSLGGTAKIKTKKQPFYTTKTGVRVNCSPSYTVVVIIPINPFKLKRKAEKWRYKWRTSFDRYVYSIKEIKEDEATCIRVASDERTFLTRNHIVTHNSLQVMNTFVMAPSATNLRQRVGYFGQDNGIYVQLDGGTLSFVERSLVNGSPSSETIVPLSGWNGDKLDGTGPSGLTIDITKAQIFWMDIEWLGVGTVRCGFVINGQLITCHSFHHANLLASTYITTGSLPLRYEITNKGATSISSTLKQVCSTVISEGGYELRGLQQAVSIPIISPITFAATNTYYPVISVRLKSTPDRLDAIAILTALSVLGKGNGINYNWQVRAEGITGGGSWTSAGIDSSVEYNITGTSYTGGRILASGFLNSSNQGSPNLDILKEALFKFQLERNGLAKTPYELALVASTDTINGSGIFASMDWEEISR